MFAQKSNNDNSIFRQLSPVAYLLIKMCAKDQELRAKYVKQKLVELEGEIYKFWIRPSQQQSWRESHPGNRTQHHQPYQQNQIKIYRLLHPTTAKSFFFFPSSYKKVLKITDILGKKKPNLNKFKRTEILQTSAVMKSN